MFYFFRLPPNLITSPVRIHPRHSPGPGLFLEGRVVSESLVLV